MTRLAAVALAALLLAPATAAARDRPSVATDAFYIGTRLAPGVALLGGWDLDIYLTRNRAVSIGPGVSVAVLGATKPDGVTQDILLSVDVLRLKVQLNAAGEEWRPYFMIGGGFLFVSLPERRNDSVAVPLPGGEGEPPHEQRDDFLGLLSFGAGADLFVGGPWALTLATVTHVRVGANERMPELWCDLMTGIRFGL